MKKVYISGVNSSNIAKDYLKFFDFLGYQYVKNYYSDMEEFTEETFSETAMDSYLKRLSDLATCDAIIFLCFNSIYGLKGGSSTSIFTIERDLANLMGIIHLDFERLASEIMNKIAKE